MVDQSEYRGVYRATFKAFDEPLSTVHFRVAGEIGFWALLFIPSTEPSELTRRRRRTTGWKTWRTGRWKTSWARRWTRRRARTWRVDRTRTLAQDMFWHCGRGVRLYLQRGFIGTLQRLVPRWLHFVRGVVDLDDLPTNAGWGPAQRRRTLKIIQKHLVRKVLCSIEDMARDQYDRFWSSYGRYLKVGLVEDLDHKDELKRFVRFYSSKSGDSMTCLPDYVERMKEGQDKIFFVVGEGKKAAETAPTMERMNNEGYEVLYMIDLLDEICSQNIVDFGGWRLVNINMAGLDLDKTEDEKYRFEQLAKRYEELAAWLKKQLGELVQKVEVGDRLVGSPATLVQEESGMSPMMRRYVKPQATSSSQDHAIAMICRTQAIPAIDNLMTIHQTARKSETILEINPEHLIIKKLMTRWQAAPESQDTEDMAMLVYETAALEGGYNIEDPNGFAKRVIKLMASTSP
jgi:HSP90 family molecular chaperone